MSLNGGYAMIKYNSTQEELQIAYRSKKPALFYDENQRAHWAVIEETATESIDEETQEPITLYEYSYRLIDEASSVVANPNLSGNEATLDGVEIDGTKYKVGGSEVHLYNHFCTISSMSDPRKFTIEVIIRDSTPMTLSSLYSVLNERYSDGAKKCFNVVPTQDTTYVSMAFLYDSIIRIRASFLSNISTFKNIDVENVDIDIISEI